jgi:hypothetical protein
VLSTSKSIPIPIYEKDGGEITLIEEEDAEEAEKGRLERLG